MKFLLKIVALPEGGGSEISAKIAEKWPKIFRRLPAVNLLLKISKVRKIEFLQFLQEFPTPPPLEEPKILEEISFSGSFDLRFSSKLGRISELRHPFHGFFEKPFFRIFRNISWSNSPNFTSRSGAFSMQNSDFFCNSVVGQTTKRTSLDLLLRLFA